MNRAPIATRNGEPAWLNAPEPKTAEITMEEWLAGHDTDGAPPAWEFHPLPGFCTIALALVVVVMAVVAFT